MSEITKDLGRYEIVRQIGQGGMAVVYLARQRELDRMVALKELHAVQTKDPSLLRRFVRESRVAGSLSHPNIVTVYDYFEWEGTPYIAMEYVASGSLRPHVGRLALAQIGGVLEGMLAGLAHAEQQGIVHRDLKPENVMVTADGRVKIADFGIAKATTELQSSSFLTATGTTLGTPSYMAPEQAMAQEVGPWTDLYSLGCMAYEMVTGRLPFADTDGPLAVLLRHVSETPPPAVSVDAAIDQRVSDWIDQLLLKTPSARPRSAATAWHELEEIMFEIEGPRWTRKARPLPVITSGPQEPGAVPGPYTPPPRAPAPQGEPFASFERPAVDTPPPRGRDGPPATPATASSGSPESDEYESYVPAPVPRPPVEEPDTGALEVQTPATSPSQPEPSRPRESPISPPASGGDASESGDDDRDVPAAAPRRPTEERDTGASEGPTPGSPAPAQPVAAQRSAAPTGHAPQPTAPAAAELADTVNPRSAGGPHATARDRAVGTRPGESRRTITVVGLAVVAAAIGIVALISRDGEPPVPRKPASSSTLAVGALRVRPPAGWAKLSRAVEVPGLKLHAATSIAPGGRQRAGSALIGVAPRSAHRSSLLPPELTEALGLRPDVVPDSARVSLRAGGLAALRYQGLRPQGFGRPITVYAAPTSAGVATLACVAPTEGVERFDADCRRLADSLAVPEAKAFPVGPSRAFAATVNGAFASLNRVLRPRRTQLRSARTAKGQASAAEAIAPAYRSATATLQRTELSPADAEARSALLRALRAANAGYRDLAAAARAADASRYKSAASEAERGERRVETAIEGLRRSGYRKLVADRFRARAIPALRAARPQPAPTATPRPTPDPTPTPTAPPATPTPTPTPTPFDGPICAQIVPPPPGCE